MQLRSPNQIWRDSGSLITSKAFNEWISIERKKFHEQGQGNDLDFQAWLNAKYDRLEDQWAQRSYRRQQAAEQEQVEEHGSEMNAPQVSGIQVDFDESKLYDAYPADGGEALPADAQPSPKTILGLPPVAFYSATAAVGLTLILIVVSIVRGGDKSKTA